MRFSDIFTAAFLVPLIAAHGEHHGAPKVIGLGRSTDASLKSRNMAGRRATPFGRPEQVPQLRPRQGGDAEGRCGAANGCASCATGYCCSPSGYCGQGQEYCQAPDCNFNYGPACDANKVPAGGSTRNTPRTQLGSQTYGGAGIYECIKPGTVAITYDDGPYSFTDGLLDLLESYGAKATFFVTGINLYKGAIDTTPAWNAVIKKMYAKGHQVASHTWSHQDLSAITKEQRYDQMIRNEMAISNILGMFPTYMRPPYSSCTAESGCEQDLADLGYTVSYFDLDTDDYNQLTAEKIQNSKDIVKSKIDSSSYLTDSWQTIAHDIHELTARNLSAYMLQYISSKNYKMVTLGECLNEPSSAWYRTPASRNTATSSSFAAPTVCGASTISASVSATSSGPVATPTGVTQDSSCGATNRLTCLGFAGGECCSQYGYCGPTEGHCGTGCQAGFGKCGIQSSSSVAVSSGVSSSVARSSSALSSSSIAQSSSALSSSIAQSSSIPSSSVARSSSAVLSSVAQSSALSSSVARSSSAQSSSIAQSSSAQSSSVAQSSSALSSSSIAQSSSAVSSSVAQSSSAQSSSSVARSSSALPSSSIAQSSSAASSSIARSSSAAASSSSTLASSSTRISSSASASPTAKVSQDGSCGGTLGYTCTGFAEGECCSAYGWCGSSTTYCGTGCNPLYGKCTSSGSSSSSSSARVASSSARASSSAAPSSVRVSSSAVVASSTRLSSSTLLTSSTRLSSIVTSSSVRASSSAVVSSSTRSSSAASASASQKVSPDASCGGTNGYTCIGSGSGNCCSQYGWCGTTTSHCRKTLGCQVAFGTCT